MKNASLIALSALLAVLVGCPETPTGTAVDADQAPEEIAATANANLNFASTEAAPDRADHLDH